MDTVALEEQLAIDFPFQLVIQHPALNVRRMFELSKLLDFHEVRQADPKLEKARHDLIVDVLYVKETETQIEVKPRISMTYDAMGQELDVIIGILAKKFNGKVKVASIDWLVDRKGMASDMRSTQKRVI